LVRAGGSNLHACDNRLQTSTSSFLFTLQPVREVVRPDNQLRLTDTELNEEIAKMLTANNPAAPRNVARFNMKERTYKARGAQALQARFGMQHGVEINSNHRSGGIGKADVPAAFGGLILLYAR
jgi:hypothetical protein